MVALSLIVNLTYPKLLIEDYKKYALSMRAHQDLAALVPTKPC